MKIAMFLVVLVSVFSVMLQASSPDFKRAVELIKKNPQKNSFDLSQLKKILDNNAALLIEHQDEDLPLKKEEVNSKDFTLLHYAAAYNAVEVFKLLRVMGRSNPGLLDVTAGESKITPLMSAAQSTQGNDVAELLLDYGASISLQMADKKNVLHCAVQNDNKELIVLLLKRGGLGLRDWADDDGKKAADLTKNQEIKDLFAPITFGRIQELLKAQKTETIKDLLSIRPKVVFEADTIDKSTCLHLMVAAKNLELVKAVLAYKPYVDAQDKLGKTALYRAVEEYFKDPKSENTFGIVIVLLRAGANAGIGDNLKKTPLTIAQEKQRAALSKDAATKMVELLTGEIPATNEDVQKECSRIGDILGTMSKQLKQLKDDLAHLKAVASVA